MKKTPVTIPIMIKTFTVHAVNRKVISPGKGSVTWQLSDEKGLPRKISGIADMDAKGIIHEVQAVYSREKPLVAALMHRVEGETFTIDFSEFNRQQAYVPRQAFRSAPPQSSFGSFFSLRRAMVILMLVCVLSFLYAAMNDVMTMSSQFPTGVR